MTEVQDSVVATALHKRKATAWQPPPARMPRADVRISLRGEVEAEFRAFGARVWR